MNTFDLKCFCVAAEELGLGFCYLGTVLYNTQSIAQLLDLPKGVVPVVTLCIGYPDEQPEAKPREEGKVKYIK